MQPTEQAQSQTPRMSQEHPPKQMQMQPAMEMKVVGTAPTSTQPGQQDPMRVRGGGAGKGCLLGCLGCFICCECCEGLCECFADIICCPCEMFC
ncbi:hypothetical protein EV121DRAFT_290441 [Schizophyllum commune]